MDPSTSQNQIRVVDFAGWTSSGPSRQRVAQEIVAACKKVGFVYIINHSLPDTLLNEAFHWSRLFFELPTAEKLRAPHPDGWAVHRGYSWPGLEKVSQAVSADNDEERTAELREIPDLKVSSRDGCRRWHHRVFFLGRLKARYLPPLMFNRKVSTSAARRTQHNQINGSPRIPSPGSGLS